MKKKIMAAAVFLFAMLCIFEICSAADDDGVRIKNSVSESVVRVSQGDSFGSGFFISDRYIVTNHHVVTPYLEDGYVGGDGWFASANGTNVQVIYSALTNDIVWGTVVQDWPEVDLAVIEIEPQNKRKPIKFALDEDINEGMNLWIVGFPGVNSHDPLTDDTPTITTGILSKITNGSIATGSQLYKRLVYDSITNPGNSGGPVVNKNGNIIGIHNSSSVEGLAFYGIHIKELATRLNTAGIPFEWASGNPFAMASGNHSGIENKGKDVALPVVIGVLAAAVVGSAIYLLNKKKQKNKTVVVGPKPKPADPTTPRASVQGMTGQFAGSKKNLSTGKDAVFGRDANACTIVFDGSAKKVSSKHCRIHYSKTHQRYVIQDLNSTNGTILVRGSEQKKVPSNSTIALRNGDVIYIPNKENSFRVNL